jgi:hypothetical protein
MSSYWQQQQRSVFCPVCNESVPERTAGPGTKNEGRQFYACDKHEKKWFAWADTQQPDGSFPPPQSNYSSKRPRFSGSGSSSSSFTSAPSFSPTSWTSAAPPPPSATSGQQPPWDKILGLLSQMTDKLMALEAQMGRVEAAQKFHSGLLRDLVDEEEAARKEAVISSNATALLSTTPGY